MYAQEATLLILCNTSEYVCGLLEWRECIQCSQWLFATVFGHLFWIIRIHISSQSKYMQMILH